MPGHGSRQLQIDEPDLDLVRDFRGEVNRQHGHEDDDDGMEVAEGDGPFERRENHGFVAEAALQERRHELGHPAERVLLLDGRCLPDDHELQHPQQDRRIRAARSAPATATAASSPGAVIA